MAQLIALCVLSILYQLQWLLTEMGRTRLAIASEAGCTASQGACCCCYGSLFNNCFCNPCKLVHHLSLTCMSSQATCDGAEA